MSWFTESLMDKVRLIAGERLDLVDARAFLDVLGAQIMEMLGALVGPTSGCLTRPVFNYTDNGTNYFVLVGACQLYYSFSARRADGSLLRDTSGPADPYGDGRQKAVRGMVLTHDPLDAGQSALSTLDYTAYMTAARAQYAIDETIPASSLPYLWARPVLLDEDTDARRQWDVGTNQEIPVAIPTRQRARVEFSLSLNKPADLVNGAGVPTQPTYVKVGRVLMWDLGDTGDGNGDGPMLPIIFPLSAWDEDSLFDYTQEPGTKSYVGTPESAGASAPDTGREDKYGKPPFEGHTAGFSAFLSPLPFDLPAHGLNPGATSVNQQNGAPVGIGTLTGVLHVMRNRLKEHLTGADTLDDRRDAYAWYELPRYGLQAIADKIDALSGRIDDADEAIVGNAVNLDNTPRIAAWLHVTFQDSDNSFAVASAWNCSVVHEIAAGDPTGKHTITFGGVPGSLKIFHVSANTLPNSDDVGSWGPKTNADPYLYYFLGVGGGFGVRQGPITGALGAQQVEIWTEGLDNGNGNFFAPTPGSFSLIAFAAPPAVLP